MLGYVGTCWEMVGDGGRWWEIGRACTGSPTAMRITHMYSHTDECTPIRKRVRNTIVTENVNAIEYLPQSCHARQWSRGEEEGMSTWSRAVWRGQGSARLPEHNASLEGDVTCRVLIASACGDRVGGGVGGELERALHSRETKTLVCQRLGRVEGWTGGAGSIRKGPRGERAPCP